MRMWWIQLISIVMLVSGLWHSSTEGMGVHRPAHPPGWVVYSGPGEPSRERWDLHDESYSLA